MVHLPKSLRVTVCSALVVGTALVAGCTIESTPATPGTPDAATPGTDAGAAETSSGGGCDFAEPNDVREQAKAIELNHLYPGLCVSNDDGADELDFFEVTAPAADKAGGLIEVQMTNVQNEGLGEIIVTSSIDNIVIFDSYKVDVGANVSGWFTASPGAKYRIQVNRFGGAGKRFAYDLFAKYTAINDTFEPNNKKDDAKPIEVNKPVQGTFAAHSPMGDLIVGDDQDWFKVTLGAGTATIKVTNVASDYLCDVQLFDAGGQKVDEKYEITAGADCVLDAKDLAGGSYTVELSRFGGLPIRGEGGNKPPAAFVLQSYTLAVQQ
jgi:hypothetical protein